jgi:hypothetical protein
MWIWETADPDFSEAEDDLSEVDGNEDDSDRVDGDNDLSETGESRIDENDPNLADLDIVEETKLSRELNKGKAKDDFQALVNEFNEIDFNSGEFEGKLRNFLGSLSSPFLIRRKASHLHSSVAKRCQAELIF